MENKRLDIPFTRPTPSDEGSGKSLTLWPAKNPQPKETTQPTSSNPQPSSTGSQHGSQGGSGSQGSSQDDKK